MFVSNRCFLLIIGIFLSGFYSFSPLLAASYSTEIDHLFNKAIKLNLDASAQWRALLHYRRTMTGRVESQVDDERFFISRQGKTNPKEELFATIRYMLDEDTAAIYQCRFPARFYWLSQTRLFQGYKINKQSCGEFENWFNELNTRTVSLIFPTAFLNGPSSMFGHTLLRLNPSDYRSSSPLAAYALNYAADSATDDNSLEYIYKGLFGGYPGKFDIVPYYSKIKEYNEIESRDIWEFELNLKQAEVDQLMRHTWEVKDIVFDYYFFSENCSYRLLALLEVVRPETAIASGFDYKAIPADTIKAVRKAGFISGHEFRASATSVLASRKNQLTKEQWLIAKSLSQGEALSEKNSEETATEKARVIEMAYELLRIRSKNEIDENNDLSKLSLKLLRQRSAIKVKDIWNQVKQPVVRDDQGHGSSRFALGMSQQENSNDLLLYYRPAFHDVLDPLDGYRAGSQINFFDVKLSYKSDSQKLTIQQLKLIDILSSTPRNELLSPVSWSFGLGTEYRILSQGADHVFYTEFSGGLSYAFFEKTISTLSLLAELDLSRKLNRDYSAGSGAQLSWLINTKKTAINISIRHMDFAGGESYQYQEAELAQSLHLSVQNSVRVKLSYRQQSGLYSSAAELAWHHYF